MTIYNCSQATVKALKSAQIDLLICSSGFESRASHLATQLSNKEIRSKVVLSFDDRVNEYSRAKNDHFFSENYYQRLTSDGDEENDIVQYLNEFLSTCTQNEITIAVDYSCMTRIWYGAILKYFRFQKIVDKKITIFFCYSLARYVKSPEKETFNFHIGPIRGFTNISIPQNPTALIICLGYEKNRALGLYEYLDGETFLFISDDVKEPKYSQEVRANNYEIIEATKNQNKYEYSINDMEHTYSLISSLCKDLSKDYRIVIAPCGPKPFTLLSLLVALIQDNIDAWRISSGKESVPVDKKPEGEIIVYQVSFG